MTPFKGKDDSPQNVLILFGPPGAGKGTQASLLSENLDYYYMETSKFLERRFKNAKPGEYIEADGVKYTIEKEKEMWGTGVLNSPPFVTVIVKEALAELYKEGNDVLIAGSPRTLYEAERVLPQLEELFGRESITIVLIEISEEETVRRNTQRRICELMRHPILSSEETKDLTKCPLDGSQLMRREGLDDAENIKTRLQQYADRTFPVFEYFKKQGYEIAKVRGDASVVEVYENILSIVKK